MGKEKNRLISRRLEALASMHDREKLLHVYLYVPGGYKLSLICRYCMAVLIKNKSSIEVLAALRLACSAPDRNPVSRGWLAPHASLDSGAHSRPEGSALGACSGLRRPAAACRPPKKSMAARTLEC